MTTLFHNDAYQLSMLYAQWKTGRVAIQATAEAYFRKLPGLNDAGMVVMAGAYRISELVNSDEFRAPFAGDLDRRYLQSVLKLTNEEFAPFWSYLVEVFPSHLAQLQIKVVADGEVLAPNFPVVQITGAVGAVHMMETPILSILNHGVRAATVARRIRRVAPKTKNHFITLLDFGTRRADPEAAVHTAVAACIGGFDGTSNMEAGRRYNLPVSGTMAHSYILSYGMNGELEAFKDFMRSYPRTHVLLVDTFDIKSGVANAIRASFETGIPLMGIRLDSGVWAETLPETRGLLDRMGFKDTKIVVSGDFDENLISALTEREVLRFIDVIGVGSRLGAPDFSIGFVYKLVEIAGAPVMKLSGDKSSLPGRKRWVRINETKGSYNKLIPYATECHGNEMLNAIARVRVSVDYIKEARSRCYRHETCTWDVTEVAALASYVSANKGR